MSEVHFHVTLSFNAYISQANTFKIVIYHAQNKLGLPTVLYVLASLTDYICVQIIFLYICFQSVLSQWSVICTAACSNLPNNKKRNTEHHSSSECSLKSFIFNSNSIFNMRSCCAPVFPLSLNDMQLVHLECCLFPIMKTYNITLLADTASSLLAVQFSLHVLYLVDVCF